MGHRKQSAPRRGSTAVHPRKRARNFTGRWRSWGNFALKTPTILGFAGYKAGMTHIVVVEDKPNSPYFGHELVKAVTIVDTPPVIVCAIRAYKTVDGELKAMDEVWAGELSEDLKRRLPTPKEYSMDKALQELEQKIDQAAELRLILHTQPRLTALPKKVPDIFESKIEGGSILDQWKFAKDLLGNELKISNVLKDGDFIDISAVTKGKGFQGPVKKFHVKKLQRKSRKTVRGIGTMGPWKPARTLWLIPRSGQMGLHQRVDLNKRVIKVGIDPKEVTPKGGFINYGLVRGDYVVVLGTIPGTRKRMVRIRKAIRRPRNIPEAPPDVVFISLESKQG